MDDVVPLTIGVWRIRLPQLVQPRMRITFPLMNGFWAVSCPVCLSKFGFTCACIADSSGRMIKSSGIAIRSARRFNITVPPSPYGFKEAQDRLLCKNCSLIPTCGAREVVLRDDSNFFFALTVCIVVLPTPTRRAPRFRIDVRIVTSTVLRCKFDFTTLTCHPLKYINMR